ncbi:MAG: SpoIIE family protein phosphatase [Flavobacteriales bacterium]|nr:SpoIIE family protein phosphatase [Flavobacteriales bacterium]
MKVRFTIGQKIGLGFAVLVFTTLIIFIFTYDTLRTGRSINDKINTSYNPSVASLEQLKSTVLRSRTLITMWAFVQSREDTKEKLSLVEIINQDIPEIKAQIDSLSMKWTDQERLKKEAVYKELDVLLGMYSEVQSTLKDMQSYDDPFARFQMTDYAEEDGLIYNQSRLVIAKLNELIDIQNSNTVQDSVAMIQAFDRLEWFLRNFGVSLFVGGLLIAFFTVRSIIIPINKLKEVLLDLGKGKFPKNALVDTGDEIGEMSRALDQMVDSLKRTTAFASEVGKGNFEIDFEPLSDEDDLGDSLLVMRDGLKEYKKERVRSEQELEQKVMERTKEVVEQKNKIEKQSVRQKELLENITASIRYAKRLQENILPPDERIARLLPESFIYYKPKDIVSGDFYFVKDVGNKVVYAAVDCTGHGVPGAFMSLVGHNALNHAITSNESLDPAGILSDLSKFAAEALNRTGDNKELSGRDSMDMALCVYDKKAGVINYAGAFNPLYLVRNNKLNTYAPDKIPIGSKDHLHESFTTKRVELEEGDMIYIFSDGYVDQFGGEKGRKFMYKPFRKLLIAISGMPALRQHKELSKAMNDWRTSENEIIEQVDDMLIIGVRHVSAESEI